MLPVRAAKGSHLFGNTEAPGTVQLQLVAQAAAAMMSGCGVRCPWALDSPVLPAGKRFLWSNYPRISKDSKLRDRHTVSDWIRWLEFGLRQPWSQELVVLTTCLFDDVLTSCPPGVTRLSLQ